MHESNISLTHIPTRVNEQIIEINDESVRPEVRFRKRRRNEGFPSGLIEILHSAEDSRNVRERLLIYSKIGEKIKRGINLNTTFDLVESNLWRG